MDKNNNIYNYKAPKSMNEETHYFLIKGRITRKSFFYRFLFAVIVQAIFLLTYFNYALPKKWDKTKILDDGNEVIYDATFKTSFYFFENLTFYFLPLFLFIFILIQFAKRMHDVNKSGWLAIVPLYNLILLFGNGTDGNNDYGISPRPPKKVNYFDELDNKTK
jgi:uncharacterized membrane protein YhaH (DUF805 family)